ncbi:MAG: ribosome biogenesis GTP-binding protein YihA/YsxC, partial [Rikenellaceae bacterium]
MIIQSADFLCSSPRVEQCPDTPREEFAFIGRSNVGKSSLINMLTGRKNLAKVSSTPGKTQMINHFVINNTWDLVDLPGYGYARITKNKKERFSKLIDGYVTKRVNLHLLFVLIDSRHEPQN